MINQFELQAVAILECLYEEFPKSVDLNFGDANNSLYVADESDRDTFEDARNRLLEYGYIEPPKISPYMFVLTEKGLELFGINLKEHLKAAIANEPA